jgi:ABC-type Fe3+-citrate transport system substrate-binding protein
LDSEDYKSKLKQIQTTHGAKAKKKAIQSKAREHNLSIEETKAKVMEGKKGSVAGTLGAWIY